MRKTIVKANMKIKEFISQFLLNKSRGPENREHVQQAMHRLDACFSKRDFDSAIQAHISIARVYKDTAIKNVLFCTILSVLCLQQRVF